MRIVLDSNEYIILLNGASSIVKDIITNTKNLIYVNELIVKEVLRNINETQKKEFYALLLRSNIILHTGPMPLELYKKYKNLGLKKGDIVIASFCELKGINYLISENRHFLKNIKFEDFKVINLKRFIKLDFIS